MNMKINKKLRLFGLLMALMALMAVGSLRGQEIGVLPNGFAGDSPITVLYTEGEYYNYVQLGSAEEERRANDEVQYLWEIREQSNSANIAFVSGPGGAVDESQFRKPRPWIRISSAEGHHKGRFELMCFRGYIGGHQRGETVIVYLTDCPEIVSITPKEGYGCWEDGDEITMDQFEVVTYPPHYAERVQLADDSRIASAWHGGTQEQDLHFFMAGESAVYELPITVIENGWQLDLASFKVDRKMLIAIDAIEKGKWTKNIEKITQVLESKDLLKNAGVEFDFSPYFEFAYSAKQKCCNGDAKALINLNCHIGVNAELGLHIPIYGFIYGDLGVKGALDLTLINTNIVCEKGCEETTILPFSSDVSAYLGVSFDPMKSPETFSVSAKVIGGITGKFYYDTTTNSWTPCKPDGYLKLNVDVVYLVGHSQWSWNLLD